MIKGLQIVAVSFLHEFHRAMSALIKAWHCFGLNGTLMNIVTLFTNDRWVLKDRPCRRRCEMCLSLPDLRQALGSHRTLCSCLLLSLCVQLLLWWLRATPGCMHIALHLKQGLSLTAREIKSLPTKIRLYSSFWMQAGY